MSHACTSLLMGVAILVLEILLLSKTAKFPFPTMEYIYSPWSSKNLIIWNQLKKFMQVEVNVLCMHSLLMGVAISVSEILLLAKTVKFPFPTMDYIPYSWFSLRDLFCVP